jgi:hypothetical protein
MNVEKKTETDEATIDEAAGGTEMNLSSSSTRDM